MRAGLLALDLDGTLLRPDGSLSARSRRALRAAQAAGWVVFPVTARPSRTVLPLARAEGWAEVACSNGAVTLTGGGAVLHAVLLNPEPSAALVESARRALPGLTFGAEWGAQRVAEEAYHALRSGQNPVDAGEEERTEDVLRVLHRPGLLKLMVRHPVLGGLELVEPLRLLAGALTVSASTASFAEITAPGADKVHAVSVACARRGLTAAEVVAFGDMPVDAPLLRWAGRGVAVANAHPEALEAADEVTLSNAEDGVAAVVERLLRDSRQSHKPRSRRNRRLDDGK